MRRGGRGRGHSALVVAAQKFLQAMERSVLELPGSGQPCGLQTRLSGSLLTDVHVPMPFTPLLPHLSDRDGGSIHHLELCPECSGTTPVKHGAHVMLAP